MPKALGLISSTERKGGGEKRTRKQGKEGRKERRKEGGWEGGREEERRKTKFKCNYRLRDGSVSKGLTLPHKQKDLCLDLQQSWKKLDRHYTPETPVWRGRYWRILGAHQPVC